MAGIAITTANEINQLTGGITLNFLQLIKQIQQVKESLDETELMGPPFGMSQEDNDQIKKTFELLSTYASNLEKEVDFATLRKLVNFRTF